MKNKNIIYVVILILFIILGSYLISQNRTNRGQEYPLLQVNKTAVQQPLPADQNKMTGIKVTFVELGSVNCIPCKMMVKVMDDIEKEYEGQVLVRFHDVNSIFGRPYAQKYGIRVIPTQVFLDSDGNEYYRHEGFFPKEDLVKVLKMKGVNQ